MNPLPSRAPPARIEPIIYKGVLYRQSDTNPDLTAASASLAAYDEKTGALLWTLPIYSYPVDPAIELDVQEVYFKSMVLKEPGILHIVDERQQAYDVDLEKREVIKNPK